MRTIACLMLMGVLTAQDLPLGKSRQPEQKTPFQITYQDLPVGLKEVRGQVLVEFEVDVDGDVVNPEIVDTFNIDLNNTVIDKVMAIKFSPALQNGRPVRVRYKLPIVFQ